jgi:LPXTG-site transpeptidase (sortase) family protein
MTKTGNTATFTGNVNGGGLTINGAGTLNLGVGLTHTFTGTWTRTAGTLNGGSSTLNLGGGLAGAGGTFTASTGTVIYNGGGAQTIAAVTYNNLQTATGGTKTLGGAVTVNGGLTVGVGTTLALGANTLTLNGGFTNNGAFTAGTGTVIFNAGGAQTIPALTYNNLQTATGGTKTLGGAVIVGGTLTVGAGTVLDTANNAVTFNGSFVNNGTFTAGSSNITIGGNSATPSIAGFSTTGSLNFTRSASTATLTGNVTAASLTMNGAGTLNLGAGLAHQINGAVNFTNGTLNGATSTLSLTGNFTGNGGTFTAATGTVNFNGAAAQFINRSLAAGIVFNNLTINNPAGVTNNHPLGATSVGGTLSLTNGVFTLTSPLTLGNGMTIIRNQGSFSATPTFGATVNVTYAGTTAVTTGSELPVALNVLNNLTINKSGGVTLNASRTVNGTLTLSNGNLDTGVNSLTIAAAGSISGGSSASHVIGNLIKFFNLGVPAPFTFAIGDAAVYAPVGLDNANVTTAGSLTVATTTAQHPNINTSAINPLRDVQRYWTLTAGGGLVFSTYDATFNYDPVDVIGGAEPATFIVQRYSVGWSSPATGTRTPTSTQATGLAAVGSFAVGELAATTTAVACVPNPVIMPAGTSCTATVMRASGSNTPTGTVTWSSSGSGNFTPANTCTLSGAGGTATCSVTYTPTVFGTGSHNLLASYSGDANFHSSSGNTDLTILDAPTTTGIADVVVYEDAAADSIDLWPSFDDSKDSDGQLTYTITSDTNPGLFAAVTVTGTPNQYLLLNYGPNANGSADLTVRATDTDGLWVETTFTVTVNPVNDAPFFVMGGDQTVFEDAGAQTIAGWASGIIAGPADEGSQSLTFTVINDNNALFSAQPAIAPNGTLTFTPGADANGMATVSVSLQDDGGTANGGVDTYTPAPNTFTITVLAVNDAPTDIGLSNNRVLENQPAGTLVGTLTTTDVDLPADSHTYSLPTGILGCDGSGNASFQIPTGTNRLETAVSFDYETPPTSFPICVRTTDSGGLSYERGFAVLIDDLDDAPPAVTSVQRQNPAARITNASAVTFRVTFTEDVSGVDSTDFQLVTTGTAGGMVGATSLVSASVYDVGITGVVGDGTLNLGFAVTNNIQDLAGNPLGASPAIGSQEDYLIDNSPIAILADGILGQPNAVTITDGGVYSTHFSSFEINYDSSAWDPAGDADPADVTNPDNYLLLRSGSNAVYDTPGCAAFASNGNLPLGDDVRVPVGPITYTDNAGLGLFRAVLTVNNGTPLPSGSYRLLVCGTTSIVDLAGNPLGGGNDTVITFRIFNPARPKLVPSTGFAPGWVTVLPKQPIQLAYTASELQLSIPRLGVHMGIVGVPNVNGEWDVSWLGNEAGWLQGSAYPTWAGNSVLTGHVWNADNSPGPFQLINTLWWGDQVIVTAGGGQYAYAIRSVQLVSPGDVDSMMRHEVLPWLTLVTCRGYDEASNSYKYRILVRAELIEVK